MSLSRSAAKGELNEQYAEIDDGDGCQGVAEILRDTVGAVGVARSDPS